MDMKSRLPQEWNSLPLWVKDEVLYAPEDYAVYSWYISRLAEHSENMKAVWKLFESNSPAFERKSPTMRLLWLLHGAKNGTDPGLERTDDFGFPDELAGALRAKAIKAQWPAWFRAVVRQARSGAFVPNHALAIQRDRQRMAREAEDAEKRRVKQGRRLDPEARARGLAAMQAAIAEMGLPPKGSTSSN